MILALIKHARPDLSALAGQLPYTEAEDRNGDVALFVNGGFPVGAPPYVGACAEAIYRDRDGQEVSLLLHVDNGLLFLARTAKAISVASREQPTGCIQYRAL
jgi:hypothetical protein